MSATAAAAAAAMIQALKASGAIVSVDPPSFLTILQRQERPLVIYAKGGLFRTSFQYLTSYKGLTFFTKSPSLLDMPFGVEVVTAGRIWIPE